MLFFYDGTDRAEKTVSCYPSDTLQVNQFESYGGLSLNFRELISCTIKYPVMYGVLMLIDNMRKNLSKKDVKSAIDHQGIEMDVIICVIKESHT